MELTEISSMNALNPLSRVESLVSPFGVVSEVLLARPARGLTGVSAYVARTGSGTSQYGGLTANLPARQANGAARGADNPEQARLVAIAEAAERYAAGDLAGETVWAKACELDGAVVDLTSIPRCSTRELSVDGCPLRPFDPDAEMRWVRGTDLVSGELTWVPAVMACYQLRDVRDAERFWLRISTGCAVHTDPVEALVRSICEVIERDAIAITWLQQLTLPVIPRSTWSERIMTLLDWCDRHFVEAFLFDATTDMGVPTVYCLKIAEFDTRLRQVVSCATARTTTAAAEKALLETLRYRCSDAELPEPVKEFRDFSDISDGAIYMGQAEMAAKFDFLIRNARQRTAPVREPLPQDAGEALAVLTNTLASKGMQAVAVDYTSRELAAVGLTATCVIIPQLQPMSVFPLAQYRAHPRLYEAPQLMGYHSYREEELNPWPQPFA